MKVLYVTKHEHGDDVTQFLCQQIDWELDLVCTKSAILSQCSKQYYDVLVLDSTIDDFEWLETIETIRERQIFTPILLITNKEKEAQLLGLLQGADMCIQRPFDNQEMMLRIRVLKRRNTNYQSPQINFEGIHLDRPDGKIKYENTSLSVSPIEIEVFRLLTRANGPMPISRLAERMNMPEEKVSFFAKCLQKKIGLLGCQIRLEIKGGNCQLVKKQ